MQKYLTGMSKELTIAKEHVTELQRNGESNCKYREKKQARKLQATLEGCNPKL